MGIYAITGASSGIGAAIGRQLKAQGHYVINISRRAAAEDAADVNISADLAMKAERGRVLEALYAAAPDGLDGFVSCSGVSSKMAWIERMSSSCMAPNSFKKFSGIMGKTVVWQRTSLGSGAAIQRRFFFSGK